MNKKLMLIQATFIVMISSLFFNLNLVTTENLTNNSQGIDSETHSEFFFQLTNDSSKYQEKADTESILDDLNYDPVYLSNSFFRENKGQFPEYFDYYVSISSITIGFGASKVFFMSDNYFFELIFLESNIVQPTGVGLLQGQSNYFYGNQSIREVQHFSQLRYDNLYNGISLIYKITPEGLKYEFLVYPNSDIAQIKMFYKGVDDIDVFPSRVELTINDHTFIDDKLDVWYADTLEKIQTRFKIGNFQGMNNKMNLNDDFSPVIQFELDSQYDMSRPIVIDPLFLKYSSFLGGSNGSLSLAIALDSVNNIYIAGSTDSVDFPSVNAYNPTFGGYGSNSCCFLEGDAFVAKLSADGSTLLYSTFIGGSGSELISGIAVHGSILYAVGWTDSTDFPLVNSFNSTYGGGNSDGFVLSLVNTGNSLIYSSFLGGNGDDRPWGVAVDKSCSILCSVYIAGQTYSTDFTTTGGANQTILAGNADIFVSKINFDGSLIQYSTFIGGTGFDGGNIDLILNSDNDVYVTGLTNSLDFPVVNANQSVNGGGEDVFITRLSSDLSSIVFSTYLGGSGDDSPTRIYLDSKNNTYITGRTTSSDFPLTPYNYNSTYSGGADVFVSKLSANGTLFLYSTYLGGNAVEKSWGIALDNAENLYIAGWTQSADFPVTSDAYSSSISGVMDCFLTILSPNGSTLLYSTYFGGTDNDECDALVLDSDANIYLIGMTSSPDYPTSDNAYNSTKVDTTFDVFIAKFSRDNINPNIILNDLSNNSFRHSGTLINLTITDNNNINALFNWDSACSQPLLSPYDVFLVSGEGLHSLYVCAQDQARNWSNTTYLFTTDDTEPLINLISLNNQSKHQSKTAINLNITDQIGTITQVNLIWDSSVSNETFISPPYQTLLPINDGNHVLKVYAFDESGNWAYQTYIFITDDTSPTVTLENPSANSINKSGIKINLNVTDINFVSEVIYYWDNEIVNHTLLEPFDLTLKTGDGQHTLNVFASDEIGNWAKQTYTFTTDDTKPVSTVSGITNDQIITFSSITTITVNPVDENGIKMVKFILGGNNVKNVFESPYSWQLSFNSSLNGNHTLVIQIIDVAGNIEEQQFLIEVNIKEDPTTQGQQGGFDGLEASTILGIIIAITLPAFGFLFLKFRTLQHRNILKMYIKEDLSMDEIAIKTGKSKREIEQILRKTKKMS